MYTYMTAEELSDKTHYSTITIKRGEISKNLIEGIHYVRPLGGKKKLYIWENIEKDMLQGFSRCIAVPMAKGGTINVTR